MRRADETQASELTKDFLQLGQDDLKRATIWPFRAFHSVIPISHESLARGRTIANRCSYPPPERRNMIKGTTITAVGLAVACAIGLASCSSAGANKSSTATTLSFIAPHPCGTPQFKPCPGDNTSTLPYDPAPTTAPTTTTTLPPTTTTTIPQPGPTTITVTGTGPANDITIDVSGSESQHTQVSLPWSTQEPQDFTGDIAMNAQDGSGAARATITCTISDNFGTLNTNTSTGPYAVVSCEQNDGL